MKKRCLLKMTALTLVALTAIVPNLTSQPVLWSPTLPGPLLGHFMYNGVQSCNYAIYYVSQTLSWSSKLTLKDKPKYFLKRLQLHHCYLTSWRCWRNLQMLKKWPFFSCKSFKNEIVRFFKTWELLFIFLVYINAILL